MVNGDNDNIKSQAVIRKPIQDDYGNIVQKQATHGHHKKNFSGNFNDLNISQIKEDRESKEQSNMTRNKSNFMSVNSPYGDDRNTLKDFLGQNKNSNKQLNDNDFTDDSNTSRPSFTEIFNKRNVINVIS